MNGRNWLNNRRGEWYVVGQGLLMGLVLLAPVLGRRSANGISSTAGAALCVGGLALVAVGSVRLGRNLSPFPKPRDDGQLVQEGVFSLVRHPIYSGFVFFTLGWSMVWRSLAALVGALVLLLFFDLKARREERWLATRFADYTEYQRRVKKLIPFVY